MTMKRRDALKTLGGLAGAATMSRLLPGCGSNSSGPEGITTIVAMLMENRSFDHFMGSRQLVEGIQCDGLTAAMSNPDLSGAAIAPWAVTMDTECVIDPPHGWDDGRAQLDGGACDGFVKVHQTAHSSSTAIEPMQYQTRANIPTCYALADNYTLCNRWFCSLLGPTYPNRYYWHSAQSNGIMDNTLPSGTPWTTIYDRLNAKGIDWAYYYGDLPVLSLLGSASMGHIFRFEQFAMDAAAGTLPPVVYIDPSFSLNDNHPPHDPLSGEMLIGAVYAALAQSPQWKNLLFVLSYDEHGGFFDHVPPPTAPDDRAADGFNQLGFRVPTMVMGPYVKKGYVSSTQFDHTSVLKHIENMFGLDPLTMRDAAATDLTDCIDMDALSKNAWNPPADVPMVMIDESMLPAACMSGMNGVAPRTYHHDILEWADQNPELLRGWDRRGDLRSYLECIHDLLAAHGGGIRWGR